MTIVHLADIRPALAPDQVLSEAMGQYESVILIGHDHDGELDARASLNLTAAQILFLIELFKMKLLSGEYAE